MQVPEFWGGTTPAQPKCAHCGAVPREAYGPTIPMQDGTWSNTDAVGTDGCKATVATLVSAATGLPPN